MLTWKTGFEIELLAPAGRTRRDLAERIAQRWGGAVRRVFHQQAEPNADAAQLIFENLTLGFDVVDGEGRRLASFVDDLTLQADLDKQAAPKPGWYRIVGDDARLLRLVERQCDAEAPLERVLDPIAALFGTPLERHASGMVRAADIKGSAVALGAPLPGERERPCEIVTAPIEREHERLLTDLLGEARALGFSAPYEGATHIHYDAAPLQSAPVIARLAEALWLHGDDLKRLCGANPHCVRLGRWPDALIALTRGEDFAKMDWQQAAEALRGVGIGKYCDYNLLNLAVGDGAKNTFEVRVLPTHLNAAPILEAAALFQALLRWCCDSEQAPPERFDAFLDVLAHA